MRSTRYVGFAQWTLVLGVSFVALLFAAGCGYVKNVRDDFNDCFILGAGVTPPVVESEGESVVAGILPPSLGLYVQATEFIQLGALRKISGDAVWDRRGHGILVDDRTKFGLGPFHWIKIKQKPLHATAYLKEGGPLEGWRKRMLALKDPIFGDPAKILVYSDDVMEPVAGETDLDPLVSTGWYDKYDPEKKSASIAGQVFETFFPCNFNALLIFVRIIKSRV